jgi:hypothetical protein
MEKIDYEWNSDYAETAMLESKIIVKVEGLVSYSNPSMLTSDDLLFSDGTGTARFRVGMRRIYKVSHM